MKRLFILFFVIAGFMLLIYAAFYEQKSEFRESSSDDLKAPASFNFILNYGVQARNSINTYEGTYTKDLIEAGTISTDMKLTQEELNQVYTMIKRVVGKNPEKKLIPDPNQQSCTITPFSSYELTVEIEDKEYHYSWNNYFCHVTPDGEEMNQLVYAIHDIIAAKEEYISLPEAQGAYQ